MLRNSKVVSSLSQRTPLSARRESISPPPSTSISRQSTGSSSVMSGGASSFSAAPSPTDPPQPSAVAHHPSPIIAVATPSPGVVASSSSAAASSSINVFVRIRPFNERERNAAAAAAAVATSSSLDLCMASPRGGAPSAPCNPIVRVDPADPTQLILCDKETFRLKETHVFDHCFWSVDSSVATDASARAGGGGQEAVYQRVGRPVLLNAVNGYNGCVFAYGQTSSGKTYTMMGGEVATTTGGAQTSRRHSACSSAAVSADMNESVESVTSNTSHSARGDFNHHSSTNLQNQHRGIIPRLTEDLFDELLQKHDAESSHSFRVEVQFYEIYNERVCDLLHGVDHNNNNNFSAFRGSVDEPSLRVRLDPVKGPFVEHLTTKTVENSEQIHELLREGSLERRTASTKMNERSSRSHAILTINIIQVRLDEQDCTQRISSKINLVDLAGSERTGLTGAEGQRFTEGTKINQSLSILGRVIDCLADQSQALLAGKTPSNTHCPYRESNLTWLLMDSLGGNSRTSMLATISPSVVNYDEIVQTIRYASRARLIVNRATVNEDPQTRKLKELTLEVERLSKIISEADLCTFSKEYVETLEQANRGLSTDLQQIKSANAMLRVDLADAVQKLKEGSSMTRQPLSAIPQQQQLQDADAGTGAAAPATPLLSSPSTSGGSMFRRSATAIPNSAASPNSKGSLQRQLSKTGASSLAHPGSPSGVKKTTQASSKHNLENHLTQATFSPQQKMPSHNPSSTSSSAINPNHGTTTIINSSSVLLPPPSLRKESSYPKKVSIVGIDEADLEDTAAGGGVSTALFARSSALEPSAHFTVPRSEVLEERIALLSSKIRSFAEERALLHDSMDEMRSLHTQETQKLQLESLERAELLKRVTEDEVALSDHVHMIELLSMKVEHLEQANRQLVKQCGSSIVEEQALYREEWIKVERQMRAALTKHLAECRDELRQQYSVSQDAKVSESVQKTKEEALKKHALAMQASDEQWHARLEKAKTSYGEQIVQERQRLELQMAQQKANLEKELVSLKQKLQQQNHSGGDLQSKMSALEASSHKTIQEQQEKLESLVEKHQKQIQLLTGAHDKEKRLLQAKCETIQEKALEIKSLAVADAVAKGKSALDEAKKIRDAQIAKLKTERDELLSKTKVLETSVAEAQLSVADMTSKFAKKEEALQAWQQRLLAAQTLELDRLKDAVSEATIEAQRESSLRATSHARHLDALEDVHHEVEEALRTTESSLMCFVQDTHTRVAALDIRLHRIDQSTKRLRRHQQRQRDDRERKALCSDEERHRGALIAEEQLTRGSLEALAETTEDSLILQSSLRQSTADLGATLREDKETALKSIEAQFLECRQVWEAEERERQLLATNWFGERAGLLQSHQRCAATLELATVTAAITSTHRLELSHGSQISSLALSEAEARRSFLQQEHRAFTSLQTLVFEALARIVENESRRRLTLAVAAQREDDARAFDHRERQIRQTFETEAAVQKAQNQLIEKEFTARAVVALESLSALQQLWSVLKAQLKCDGLEQSLRRQFGEATERLMKEHSAKIADKEKVHAAQLLDVTQRAAWLSQFLQTEAERRLALAAEESNARCAVVHSMAQATRGRLETDQQRITAALQEKCQSLTAQLSSSKAECDQQQRAFRDTLTKSRNASAALLEAVEKEAHDRSMIERNYSDAVHETITRVVVRGLHSEQTRMAALRSHELEALSLRHQKDLAHLEEQHTRALARHTVASQHRFDQAALVQQESTARQELHDSLLVVDYEMLFSTWSFLRRQLLEEQARLHRQMEEKMTETTQRLVTELEESRMLLFQAHADATAVAVSHEAERLSQKHQQEVYELQWNEQLQRQQLAATLLQQRSEWFAVQGYKMADLLTSEARHRTVVEAAWEDSWRAEFGPMKYAQFMMIARLMEDARTAMQLEWDAFVSAAIDAQAQLQVELVHFLDATRKENQALLDQAQEQTEKLDLQAELINVLETERDVALGQLAEEGERFLDAVRGAESLEQRKQELEMKLSHVSVQLLESELGHPGSADTRHRHHVSQAGANSTTSRSGPTTPFNGVLTNQADPPARGGGNSTSSSFLSRWSFWGGANKTTTNSAFASRSEVEPSSGRGWPSRDGSSVVDATVSTYRTSEEEGGSAGSEGRRVGAADSHLRTSAFYGNY